MSEEQAIIDRISQARDNIANFRGANEGEMIDRYFREMASVHAESMTEIANAMLELARLKAKYRDAS